jgi:hypothetical protein
VRVTIRTFDIMGKHSGRKQNGPSFEDGPRRLAMSRVRSVQSLIRSHAGNLGPKVMAVVMRVMVVDACGTHGAERNRLTNAASIQRPVQRVQPKSTFTGSTSSSICVLRAM